MKLSERRMPKNEIAQFKILLIWVGAIFENLQFREGAPKTNQLGKGYPLG